MARRYAAAQVSDCSPPPLALPAGESDSGVPLETGRSARQRRTEVGWLEHEGQRDIEGRAQRLQQQDRGCRDDAVRGVDGLATRAPRVGMMRIRSEMDRLVHRTGQKEDCTGQSCDGTAEASTEVHTHHPRSPYRLGEETVKRGSEFPAARQPARRGAFSTTAERAVVGDRFRSPTRPRTGAAAAAVLSVRLRSAERRGQRPQDQA